MPASAHTFVSPLWEWPTTAASWFFVNLSAEASEIIRDMPRETRAGFGSVRVEVMIGNTKWRTSIFPDSKAGVYILPVKKAVRTAESLEVGDTVEVTVAVL